MCARGGGWGGVRGREGEVGAVEISVRGGGVGVRGGAGGGRGSGEETEDGEREVGGRGR